MPKLRYSWPFLFAILGNLVIWEEVTYQGLSGWVDRMGLFSNPDTFFTLFGGSVAISMFGITVYQLWINRFPKDQRWQMVIWGVIFSGTAIAVFYGVFGMLDPNELLVNFGAWCLLMLILYVVRQWRKPRYLMSKFTRPKNIAVMMTLGMAVVLTFIQASHLLPSEFFDGGNESLFLPF